MLLKFINEDVEPKVQNTETRNQMLVSNLLAFFITYKEKFHDSLRATLNLIKYFEDKKELIMRSFKYDSMMDYLTDYVIDQASNEASSSDDKSQDRQMFITWMAVCFSVKDDVRFSKSFDRMASNMIHLYGYDVKKITQCVEREEVFASEVELPIIEHLRTKIPKLGLLSYASGWLKDNLLVNILGIKSFLLYCSDWGTDMQQTVKFHDGCCSLNSTITNDTSKVEEFSFETRIGESDYLVAFCISIIVLLLTTIFHFILCVYSNVHNPMIAFFNGSCCKEKMRRNSGSKRVFIKVIIAFFLPFFSKFYTTFLMPIQLYQFRKNWSKIEELKTNLHESHKRRWRQFPRREKDHYCNFCKECQEPDSFCYYCGFRNANSTTSYEYREHCKKIESELLAQDGFNRIGEMVLENTYLPIVQLFIGLPLLLKNVTSLNTSNPHYTDLGLVLFSVGTSILSLSIGITSLYFSQGKKSALAKDKKVKYLYTLSMICQITSRLMTFCVFGLLYFDKNEFALTWMMLSCFIHVLFVFLLRTILWITDNMKSEARLETMIRNTFLKNSSKNRNQNGFKWQYVLTGSFLSVFTFV